MNKKQLIVVWIIDGLRYIFRIPNIEKIKKAIKKWIADNPRLTKVYLFGSYVKKNKIIPRDIDIAIEISDKEWDTASGFWCSEADNLKKQLSQILNYNVDVCWFNGDRSPIVKKGLTEGSMVMYETGGN